MRLILDSDADAEFRDAIGYYDRRQIGLGMVFREAVAAAFESIRQQSMFFPIDDDSGMRYCTVKRFPFSVYFLELDDAIWIVAVAHQRRRPHYWKNRRPPGT